MAPTEPNRKRKRGRPPRSDPKHESAQPEADTPAEPDAAPKKRGRPRKSVDAVAQSEMSPAANRADPAGPSDAPPKKRGRPPKTRDAQPEEENSTEARPNKRRKPDEPKGAEEGQQERDADKPTRRGKTSTSESGKAPDTEEQSTGERSRRSGRNRRENADLEQPSSQESRANAGQAEKAKGKPGRKPSGREEQPAEDQAAAENSTRRSRRERRSADDKPWWTGGQGPPQAAGTSKKAPDPPKRKRGRPSLAEVSASNAQNQASPPQLEQAQKKGRGRPRRTSNEANSPTGTSKPTNTSKPTQNRRHSPASNRAAPASPQPAPDNDHLTTHRHLTTLTRNIPRSTITSKWTPLDTPSITAISSLITESTLPVLHRLRDRDQRHAQAQSILRTFAARLQAKLVKGMPFPPASVPPPKSWGRGKDGKVIGGHEVEFDFEKTVDAIAGLERALDPLLHSVVLLRGEKEREERALEREYEALRRLEGNARAQVRGWREKEARRREHVLVPVPAGVAGEKGTGGDMGGGGLGVVVARKGGGGGVFEDLQEEELLGLSQQIGSHMESMRNNLSQIDGVLPAIAKSRAALQGTLCEHLDPEQYEQVLLG